MNIPRRMNIPRMLKFIYYAFMFSTVALALAQAQTSAPTTISSTGLISLSESLCGIVSSIRTVIGVIAILLFITGGALYAGAHMLPAAGNLRGNLQGWSMGMIIGAVVGLILVLLAPTIISTISGVGGSAVSTC
jgi:type IV secretory pathway VirB2 component (pilin)